MAKSEVLTDKEIKDAILGNACGVGGSTEGKPRWQTQTKSEYVSDRVSPKKEDK